MAVLNFPSNPFDGQLYPDPAVPGAQQYVWNEGKGTWLTVFKGVEQVLARNPLFISGEPSAPIVNINEVTTTQGGYMSAADKIKLDALSPSEGTVTDIEVGTGLGAPDTGDHITTTGKISLLPPTPVDIGGVKAGLGVTIATDGTLAVKPPSSVNIGAVKAGKGIGVTADGTLSLAAGSTYTPLDNIEGSFNGLTKVFNLTSSGSPVSPFNVNALLLFIDKELQLPNVDYTLIGSSITFVTAPTPGKSFYGISLT